MVRNLLLKHAHYKIGIIAIMLIIAYYLPMIWQKWPWVIYGCIEVNLFFFLIAIIGARNEFLQIFTRKNTQHD